MDISYACENVTECEKDINIKCVVRACVCVYVSTIIYIYIYLPINNIFAIMHARVYTLCFS